MSAYRVKPGHPVLPLLVLLSLAVNVLAQGSQETGELREQALEVVVVHGTKPITAKSLPLGLALKMAAPTGAMTALTSASLSLQATAPDNKNTGIYMRGLGTMAFNDGLSSSVKLLQDGVYLGRQGMFPMRLYDLAQVEVRRGPSIADAGPAGSAGSIHVKTRPPEWLPGYRLEASAGSNDLRGVRYAVTGPLVAGRLAGRISGYHYRRDGAILNETSGERVNTDHHQAVRGQLLWQPLDQFSSRLVLEHSRLAEECCAYSPAHYSDLSLARAAALGHELIPADPDSARVRQDGASKRLMAQDAATLRVSWWPAEETELLSISAWRDWSYNSQLDLDGIDLPIVDRGGWRMDHRQWSQEFRLRGAWRTGLRYEVGALYLEQRHQRNGFLTYGPAAASWFLAQWVAPGMLEGGTVHTPASQRGSTASLFGGLDWRGEGGWELSGALRFSRDRRQGKGERKVSGLQPLPADPTEAQIAQILRKLALGESRSQSASTGGEQVDLQLRLEYPLADHWKATLGWASAHKPQGINGEIVSGQVSATFDAEQTRGVTAGLMWHAPSGDVEWQLTLYQQQVADYQTLTYHPDSSLLNPQMNNIINVDRVRSRGVEFEGQMAFDNGLRLHTGLAYNDARYRRFANAPCAPESGQVYCDYSGLQLDNAPRWTSFVNLEHRLPLARGITAYSGLDYQWRSGYSGTTERGQGSAVSGRGLVELRLGLRHEHWDLRFWVHNALDERYAEAILALNGSGDYGALSGEPRAVGVTVSLSH